MMRRLSGMALLSAATLLLQVTLTRILSIAQFYHFAFLVISLALLGFGASGTLLTLAPGLQRRPLAPWYALSFALTLTGAYLLVNHLPFDSYSIATDASQVLLLILNLLALAIPFVFSGALVGALLAAESARAGPIYGANMAGSALGAILAPFILNGLGSERALLMSALWGAAAAWVLVEGRPPARPRLWAAGIAGGALLLLLTLPPAFQVRPSPYKTLSHFRLNPGATIIATRESAASRLDIVQSSTIHSAPGLSLSYLGQLPPQLGLVLDGDTLLTVAAVEQAAHRLAAAMPAAPAYALRPAADTLLLGSGGNLEAWIALENGAAAVTVVEPDRLVYTALREPDLDGLYADPRVRLLHSEIRTYVQAATGDFDIVLLTLRDNYRPITSGAFSLSENYTLTVEAFRHYLRLVGEDGLLVLTRWLQTPPSESLRSLALILAALEADDPLAHIVVFRSFQTATFIVKPTPFSEGEIAALLQHIEALRYDLVLAPEMPAHLINQHARLPDPIYHEAFLALVNAPDRAAFYATYPFDISPPTDDRPFFYHFFRWAQTADILEELGRRWQPFGGSGYFVLVVLLAFAAGATALFVLLPVAFQRRFRQALSAVGSLTSARILLYFALLGLAYLMVEVALVQQFILILGQPTLAMATIIGALLLSSGLGSLVAAWLPWRRMLVTLAALLALTPWLVDTLTPLLLSLPPALRLVIVVLLILPVGGLMGMPFPRGIAALSQRSALVPWAWAANGGISVVSSVLAVLFAMGFGLSWVLLLGGGLYLLAALLVTTPPPA